MADEERKKTRKSKKRSLLGTYFFLNGDLHKKIVINRGADTITAWNYPREKKMTYTYSQVIRRHEKAFTTTEVCKLVNRKKATIYEVIDEGHIHTPQYTYGIDENKTFYKYMWKEKDIMDLHAYLSTVHHGRPRKDGLITVNDLPTPREIRALIRNEEILYAKQGDTFVPTWKAKDL